ncbi:DUF3575 domain-containing protein [Flavobacterium sp. '19STA2R22 D10 B1']|uniref:DUF3575 domain-containing protein n=1 Tax=Flavobacterium aerium TaxID=3037261 RepID=UPI00278BDD7C|nr:DUF3575 domain-containing protein [Flavobacterium sp. '19STA2R22 D10 B1']
MKKIFFLTLFFTIGFTQAQTYVKLNGLSTVVGLPNAGFETSIGKKMTFQLDAVTSVWKSRNGAPFQLLIVIPEVRYHFNEKYNGFYVGAHVGGGAFRLQKWNYNNTNKYQKGYNYYVGATIGYQWKLSDKWLLDAFVGGGTQQGAYKGYYIGTDERYETAKNYNKSGEWLPYRGGLMIAYKID